MHRCSWPLASPGGRASWSREWSRSPSGRRRGRTRTRPARAAPAPERRGRSRFACLPPAYRRCHRQIGLAPRQPPFSKRMRGSTTTNRTSDTSTPITASTRRGQLSDHALPGNHIPMEITIKLDDDLLREATAIHRGKTSTAVLELGLRELINADQRKRWPPPPGLSQTCNPPPARAWAVTKPGTRSDQAAVDPTGCSVTNL